MADDIHQMPVGRQGFDLPNPTVHTSDLIFLFCLFASCVLLVSFEARIQSSRFPLGFVPFVIGLGYGFYLWYRRLKRKAENGVRLRPIRIGDGSESGIGKQLVVGGASENQRRARLSLGSNCNAPQGQSENPNPTGGTRAFVGEGVPPGDPPSVPPPRIPATRAFALRLLLFFAAIVVPLLWFSPLLFGYYDRAVAFVGGLLYWPVPWPGLAIRPIATQPTNYIFLMYLSVMIAYVATIATSPHRPYSRAIWWLTAGTILTYSGLTLMLAAVLDATVFPAFWA